MSSIFNCSACLYSRANWDAIEANLKQALLVETEAGGDKAIKILCGGALAQRLS